MRIDSAEVGRVIHDVIKTLGEREAGVMTLRWGLNDGYPRTRDEIGKIYGVTRERVRQIEMKSMSKLRSALHDSPLVVTDGSAVVEVADVRRTATDDASTRAETLVWCTHCHQRRFIPGRGSLRTSGRPRKYCSNKCRQAAYRERHRSTDKPSVNSTAKKTDEGQAIPGIHAKR
jgi:hypothetical protein